MTNVNTAIAEALQVHNIDLMKVDAALRKRIFEMLSGLEKDIVKHIGSFDPSGPVKATIRNKRMASMMTAVNTSVSKVFEEIATVVGDEQKAVAALEAAASMKAINGVLNVELASGRLSLPLIQKLADNTLIEGAPSKEWWKTQDINLRQAFKHEMRQGVLNNETISDLVRRVRGRREHGFKDGIMSTSTHKARALVRSSVMATANAARLEVYKANDDVIKGTQWLSTLDSRTCFTAGHGILMADGSWKEIQKIEVGDWVLGGLSKQPRKVLNKIKKKVSTVVIQFNTGYNVQCTPEHPFLTEYGWQSARELSNKRVRTYFPKGETVYRYFTLSKETISAAHQWWNTKFWQTDSNYSSPQQIWFESSFIRYSTALYNLREGFRVGKIPDSQVEYNSSKWIQSNQWWRRDCRITRAHSKRSRAQESGPLQKRPRMGGRNAKNSRGFRTESWNGFEKVVGDTSGRKITPIPFLPGIPQENLTSKQEASQGILEEMCPSIKAFVERPGISGKGKRGQEQTPSGITPRPGISGKGPKEAFQVYEETVARSYLHSQTRGQSQLARNKKQDGYRWNKITQECHPRARNRTGQKSKCWDEGLLGQPGEQKTYESGYEKVERIKEVGPALVYDIEIETDHAFICEGYIVHNSDICKALDGQSWTLEGKRLPGTALQWRGPPPAHWQCRSTLVPVTRSWSDLTSDPAIKKKLRASEKKLPKGYRASMDGKVSDKLNYEEWLKTKPKAFQLEVLGPTKYALWQQGKLPFTQLVDQGHNPLSVAALEVQALAKTVTAIVQKEAMAAQKIAAQEAVKGMADIAKARKIEQAAKYTLQQAQADAVPWLGPAIKVTKKKLPEASASQVLKEAKALAKKNELSAAKSSLKTSIRNGKSGTGIKWKLVVNNSTEEELRVFIKEIMALTKAIE